jgi:hypothetical protein
MYCTFVGSGVRSWSSQSEQIWRYVLQIGHKYFEPISKNAKSTTVQPAASPIRHAAKEGDAKLKKVKNKKSSLSEIWLMEFAEGENPQN